MPEVVVRHKGVLSLLDKSSIWRTGSRFIAEELDCDDPDGRLTSDDIMMFFEQVVPGEACAYDLYFRVEAMTYPSRLANIKERTIKLRDRLQRFHPDKSIGVWVKLSEGYWAETDVSDPEASTMGAA